MVKKHSVSDTARTASLTECFFGQNRKLKRSRKTDLGVERSRNPDLGKKNPDLGAGSDAGQARLCRAAGASQPFAKKKRAAVLPPREDWNFCDIGATNVGRARFGRARTHWASHQTRLGRAIKRGWGEPSNEVGRASTKPLGEPLNHSLHACFKAAPWRYGASARARSALCQLGTFS